MTLRAPLKTFVLAVHVISSVGWIGAVVAYLALVFAALTSDSAQTVRAAFLAMEMTYFVLVPLAIVALLTGLVQSLGTAWGLFRHYWVVFKLVLTLLATAVLLGNMSTVGSLADDARMAGMEPPDAGGQLLHAGVGLVVLVMTAILGLYKPRGLTRYGQRKQRELRARGSQDRPADAEEQRELLVP
jgi:hypothetical protein